MLVNSYLTNFERILYIKVQNHIQEKHFEFLGNSISHDVEVCSVEQFERMNLKDGDNVLIIASTSTKKLNTLLHKKKCKYSLTIALFQDGVRIRRRLGAVAYIYQLVDLLFPSIGSSMSRTYIKPFVDTYIVYTNEAELELKQYIFIKDKIRCVSVNKSYDIAPMVIPSSLERITLIDQPVEIYFKDKTSEIYNMLSDYFYINNTELVVNTHPSPEYNVLNRRSVNFNNSELYQVNNVYITFFSTLGFELLKRGLPVFFLRQFIPNIFKFSEKNIFILDDYCQLFDRISLLKTMSKDIIYQEQTKLINWYF
ncbi:hypothetical protein KO525_07405 [Psychrosphaera sp. B3R10]|uniref:hypothetical protein n=1 Tax=unclassified Psychrosphaera TaxID=2641570 RepID=UPI001C089BDB|nr:MULTISPECIES: hypothetical protein [unclassified Psychrosphaera]MBU2881833.1 hypothetical protein [Psychrosphaera sp. I2R16]MBU2989195.1 hypothetical protein [Psychrosphaera sp. B3R10]MDO6719989.1 hypothetical protein [Psychrosphaera sp. 1_MG-2023]